LRASALGQGREESAALQVKRGPVVACQMYVGICGLPGVIRLEKYSFQDLLRI
jgi:hypothetical protein